MHKYEPPPWYRRTNGQKSKSLAGGLKMSCRIDRVVGDDEVVLGISGRITKQDLDTLHTALEAEGGAVVINIENVELVDRDVVKFLAQRELSGTALRNCSAYIREWVNRERTELLQRSGNTNDA